MTLKYRSNCVPLNYAISANFSGSGRTRITWQGKIAKLKSSRRSREARTQHNIDSSFVHGFLLREMDLNLWNWKINISYVTLLVIVLRGQPSSFYNYFSGHIWWSMSCSNIVGECIGARNKRTIRLRFGEGVKLIFYHFHDDFSIANQ